MATPSRLHEFFERSCDRNPNGIALVVDGTDVTYRDLDQLANALATQLRHLGIESGSRVGIVVERSLALYVGLLGASKSGATIVPMDADAPTDRLAFICDDADVDVVLLCAATASLADALGSRTVVVDCDALRTADCGRPGVHAADDGLAYVMYTSGSTGRPKGVCVSHQSIAHFLSVAPPAYGVVPRDRVYQGMTIAFDFSIEEIWVPWAVGAAVVAGPSDHRRMGQELAEFLTTSSITVFCCVPTLLATLDGELPTVRLLMLGGEACPAELVERWDRPGRRILNTYGPTETTVTATVAELHAGRPVTIGTALPGYRVDVRDDASVPVPQGEVGEICIGGPGVARGYLNLPEATAAVFLDTPERTYRTGDLGRFTANGEIQYLGRNDGQVKIRGYRIDLAEIESVLLECDGVVAAAVARVGEQDAAELVAYVVSRHAESAELRGRLLEHLRRLLPAYMVPSFVELIPALPTNAAGKVDRGRLPQPRSARVVRESGVHSAPQNEKEREVADAFERVLGCSDVSTTADFFLDLGGHSLYAARLVSLLRRHYPGVGIADVYAHPSVRDLAGILGPRCSAPAPDAPPDGPPRRSARSVRIAAMAQVGLLYLLLLPLTAPLAFLMAVDHLGPRRLFIAGVLTVAASTLVGVIALPVLAGRLLTRRLRPGRYPLWGATFLRVWLSNKLMLLAPLGVLSGSPLAGPYLRLLGARVGRDCHVGTSRIELPTLVAIGDRTSIGFGAVIQPYEVADGWITIAPVDIGADCYIGANSVVVGGASVGDGARVADQSLVSAGQEIAPHADVAGSPASPTDSVDAVLVELEGQPAALPSARRRYGLALYAVAALVPGLLPIGAAIVPGAAVAWTAAHLGIGAAVIATFAAGPAYVLITCAMIAVAHRVVAPKVGPGVFQARSTVGFRKWLADKFFETSLSITNSLFGTLYAGPWLRVLGAAVGRRAEVSTVANIDPALLELGHESFVADLATVGGATYHRGHVALGRTVVGRRSFIGNAAVVRASTTVGKNSLVGVSTVVSRGAVPPGTTWLGSPALSFPRRETTQSFPEDQTYRPRRSRVLERLVIEFFRVTVPAIVLGFVSLFIVGTELSLRNRLPALGLVLASPIIVLAGGALAVAIVVVCKWTIVGRYRPRVEPLWSRFVRRTELVTGVYEAAAVPALLMWLTGSPLLPPVLRLLGARVGRGVWCDTTYLTEFDLVRIDDGVCVGGRTSLQTHLFEDRVMKMARVHLAAGATVGARSVVLYDARVGRGSRLDALSLVMKAEELPDGTAWRGIPAAAVPS